MEQLKYLSADGTERKCDENYFHCYRNSLLRCLFDGLCVFHVLHLAPIPLISVGPPPGGSAAA